MRLQVQIDDTAAQRLLRGFERQIPFATALALTRTAQAAQREVRQEMTRVFDRPTRFALNATYVKPAKRTDLEAAVFLKDLPNRSGTDALTRFAPQVFGGDRLVKKFEAALFRVGLLRAGETTAPGRGADLDAFGNIRRAQINEILGFFQAYGANSTKNWTQQKRAKRARGTRNRRGASYFVKQDRPGRGIYQATSTGFGTAIKPVLMFTKRAQYAKRLDVMAVVKRTSQQVYEREFAKAARQALNTARST